MLQKWGTMAKIADLKLAYQMFMKLYPYRRADWGAGAVLSKPLSEARVALVTTAGFFCPGQKGFDPGVRGGDVSYRAIDAGTAVDSLLIGQKSDAFDHAGIESDRNLALPLDRLRELAAEGRIGDVAPRHFSFMGSISAPGRLIAHTAPEAAGLLRADGVDAVFLTPV